MLPAGVVFARNESLLKFCKVRIINTDQTAPPRKYFSPAEAGIIHGKKKVDDATHLRHYTLMV